MRFIGGTDGKVAVVGAAGAKWKWLGTFEWGKKPATPRCIDLARAILTELLPGDQVRMAKLYLRFMHRTVTQWKPGIAWTQTDTYLLSVVKEIEQAEIDGAQMIAASRNEVPRVQMAGPQFPGKTGFGSNDTAPDRKR